MTACWTGRELAVPATSSRWRTAASETSANDQSHQHVVTPNNAGSGCRRNMSLGERPRTRATRRTLSGQPSEECLKLQCSHLRGMWQAVVPNEAAVPVKVGLLRSKAVVQQPGALTQLIQQSRRSQCRLAGGGRLVAKLERPSEGHFDVHFCTFPNHQFWGCHNDNNRARVR
jgi:hypothetical protein